MRRRARLKRQREAREAEAEAEARRPDLAAAPTPSVIVLPEEKAECTGGMPEREAEGAGDRRATATRAGSPSSRPPMRPKRPERAYMDILKNVPRTVLRSASHLEIDDDVPPGRLGRGRRRR